VVGHSGPEVDDDFALMGGREGRAAKAQP